MFEKVNIMFKFKNKWKVIYNKIVCVFIGKCLGSSKVENVMFKLDFGVFVKVVDLM